MDEPIEPQNGPKEATKYRAAGSHARLIVKDAFLYGRGEGKRGVGPTQKNQKNSRPRISINRFKISGFGGGSRMDRLIAPPLASLETFILLSGFCVCSARSLCFQFWGVAENLIKSIRFDLIWLGIL